ncbi:response regulator [Desertifilum sp. FACHB-1129]|uniref:histidine kinase n=2 Tax=Desertifilum tharense IPPAS B-1220 TaxID=1781255 RepID=A0A1E5QH91_9CYAN|nr:MULTISPECIES: response regulator [Desertifilum]MDA0209420.1 response regulator [Cyanobacteria bacterium FC1]MBD2315120.1 response regulator [Desertifilum sp. FACHB-1129]MBD2324576.1 response regulator [Desertifilum sp. FACHB-866]MBD2334667.1 response regulator [Desertifilum sp. FACHB-868]OEJ74056.1 hybrid sensor histidine kinase/response regulator [Desertifilum tharense IPPAS B-1220]
MSARLSQETILVIDDNPTNLEVLYNALSISGYDVLVEMDGSSGLAQAHNYPPDLILLDVMMPGIDGFETCRQLQENPATCKIPIIFMTALADTVDKVKGLHLGAVDYITKPFQKEEVLARIQTQLKLRRLSLELEQQKQELERTVELRTAELTRTIQELKATQLQLIQSEKLSTVGQLVAGIAHEINNPVGFLNGNLEQAYLAIQDLIDYIRLYHEIYPAQGTEIEEKAQEIEIDYLLEDLPKMLLSMQVGVERICSISNSLRTFSRADVDTKVFANIHEGLESTLMILQHRLKAQKDRPEIQVIKNYGEIPKVECYLGQLNQVFMNILANAIDALEEGSEGRGYQELEKNPNQILVQTSLKNEREVMIRISDNGVGIGQGIKDRIFDHLFTTKPVGKGTGLGLTIARQIIVEKHEGTLEFISDSNRGTTFAITLPVS